MGSDGATIQQIGGKYRVIAQLGQGGTADVSLAVARGPKGFSKLVVLKSMRPQFRVEPDFAEMFMNEAKLAARLNHPNVVQTYEVFDFDGLPVIVMEFLEGQPLSSIMTRYPEPTHLAIELRIVADALAGLHYSHELLDFDGQPLGVVHRDISPHNIFVTYEGQVKLLDFGIAKLNRSNVETEAGVLKGKLRYMPPEQIVGDDVDRRADVYAAGVMLWEVATRKKMWGSASEANIMNAVLNGEIPKPSTVAAVDPALEAIIVKATAVEREERFPTAAIMAESLEEFLTTFGTEVRPRDISAFVTRGFEDLRVEHSKRVQEQMAVVQALSDEDYQTFLPIELGRRETGTVTMEKRGPAQRRAGVYLALAGAAVVAALLLFFFFRPRDAGGAKATVGPQVVRVSITASPDFAEIAVDGQKIPGNPVNLSETQSASRVVKVVVSAPGYETKTLDVGFRDSREIRLSLVPLPTAPRTVPLGSADPVKHSKPGGGKIPKPVAKPNTVSCDPPYFIDERGIKKFKPQCL